MKKPEPLRVSDHAVLRYLERGMGLDIEMVRKHIADLCAGPAALGAVCVISVVVSEKLRFEISGNTVVTVRPDGGHVGRTTKERNQRIIERERPNPT